MKVSVVGVPSNVGALNNGPEQGPKYFRRAGLIEKLGDKHEVVDLGDIAIDNHQFRHNYGAVRNWPAPLIMWEKIAETEGLFALNQFTIVLGGGCSIVTGVFRNFYNQYGGNAQLLTIDHHIDIRRPSPDLCMGATAYALYFLTQDNQWVKSLDDFNNEKITAMGFDPSGLDNHYAFTGLHTYPLEVIQEAPQKSAQTYLNGLPEDAKVLVHLDLDVIGSIDFKSVYMPSATGIGLNSLKVVLSEIFKDQRVGGTVITDFTPTDASDLEVKLLVDLLRDAL